MKTEAEKWQDRARRMKERTRVLTENMTKMAELKRTVEDRNMTLAHRLVESRRHAMQLARALQNLLEDDGFPAAPNEDGNYEACLFGGSVEEAQRVLSEHKRRYT